MSYITVIIYHISLSTSPESWRTGSGEYVLTVRMPFHVGRVRRVEAGDDGPIGNVPHVDLTSEISKAPNHEYSPLWIPQSQILRPSPIIENLISFNVEETGFGRHESVHHRKQVSFRTPGNVVDWAVLVKVNSTRVSIGRHKVELLLAVVGRTGFVHLRLNQQQYTCSSAVPLYVNAVRLEETLVGNNLVVLKVGELVEFTETWTSLGSRCVPHDVRMP